MWMWMWVVGDGGGWRVVRQLEVDSGWSRSMLEAEVWNAGGLQGWLACAGWHVRCECGCGRAIKIKIKVKARISLAAGLGLR